MQLNIQKWGNSAALRLPSVMLRQVGAKIGDSFEVDVSDQTVALRIAKPRYKLADLLAQCNPRAPKPPIEGWDDMPPVGQEVW